MATVTREIEIGVPAAGCWAALRDFGALDRRLELADRTAGLMEAGLKAMKTTLAAAKRD